MAALPIRYSSLQQGIPVTSSSGGYLLGRLSQGTGPAEMIPIADVVTQLPARYQLGFSFVGGIPANSQLCGLHRFSTQVTFPPNFGDYASLSSQAGGTANTTGSTVFNVDQAASATPNTWTTIGTITFGAGGVTPTFATTSAAAKTFAKGDVLRVIGPGTADATFANPYFTLVGHEG